MPVLRRKIQLSKRKAAWVAQFKPKVLKGAALRVPISIEARYFLALDKLMSQMIHETVRDVVSLYETHAEDAFTMDASLASQARIVTNALWAKFDAAFARVAQPIAERMTDEAAAAGEKALGSSLREIAGNISFDTGILGTQLNDVVTATVAENAALIKRIPKDYLGNVQGAVMRSIQQGNGLADLRPELDKYGVKIRNWAKNVAADQTRKAYNGINAGRMKSLGVDKFEWVHSHGSNNPREYHKETLNGKIFSLSDPPVIDERTKEKGIPGQLPYCRCTMRPVVSFDDDED